MPLTDDDAREALLAAALDEAIVRDPDRVREARVAHRRTGHALDLELAH